MFMLQVEAYFLHAFTRKMAPMGRERHAEDSTVSPGNAPKNTPGIPRRTFLRRLVAAAAVLPLARLLSACKSDLEGPTDLPSSDSVLVIGAGISGLAAASELKRKGLTVTVLEARDRTGGRINTSLRWKDLPADLGASWIHGTTGNPITELADELGLERVVTDWESAELYDADGNAVSDSEEEARSTAFDELLSDLEDLREQYLEAEKADISLGAAIEQLLSQGDYSEAELHDLAFTINTEIEQEYAADATSLSFLNWDQGEAFDGDQVVFPNGYSDIPNSLAEGLDIRLNQVVTLISLADDGVTVQTETDSFSADRVIVTVPLGVLKRGSIQFDPALPDEKLKAIDLLEMGLLNKLYLRFPSAFWSDDDVTFIEYKGEQTGPFAETLNLYKIFGVPALMMFNACSYAHTLEDKSDEETIAAAMEVLRTLYGTEIPEPSDYQITRWGQDPFAWGSYSYIGVGASGEDSDALAAPVGTRLFFAGEATNRDYSSTVHGAYMSGMREAGRWSASSSEVDVSRTRAKPSTNRRRGLRKRTKKR